MREMALQGAHATMLMMAMAQLALVPRCRAGLPFGNAMEGSEQLEASVTVDCAARHEPCQKAVDVRSIYKHTHPDFPDHRLALGPHAYVSLSVFPGGAVEAPRNYSVLLHQGGYSTSQESAIAKAINVQGRANIATHGCSTNLFDAKFVYVTILCAESPAPVDAAGADGGGEQSRCAASYDLSFALKKAVVAPNTVSTHLVPPLVPVVLALPVQADGLDPLSPYDISLEVESTYPQHAAISLGFLHTTIMCSENVEEALSNQAAAGWPQLHRIFQRVQAPHADTSMYFIAVRSNATKRTLVRLLLKVSTVSGARELDAQDEMEHQYLRRMLIGDRCFARGSFLEALFAFQSAQQLLPDRAAAPAKEFLLLEAAGALQESADPQKAAATRERALYPLVRELGDALSSALAPLEGLRASRVRAVRYGMVEALALARRQLAESMAQGKDLAGAAHVIALSQSELAHLPKEAMFQAQWEASVFFRRHQDWARAAEQLEQLSRSDPGAGIVKLELAAMYYKLSNFRGADSLFESALEMDASLMRLSTAVMHAEATLRAWGCGNASSAIRNAHRALTLVGEGSGEAERAYQDQAHDVVAVASLCLQGAGRGYDGAIASLTPWVTSSSPAPPQSSWSSDGSSEVATVATPPANDAATAAAGASAPALPAITPEVLERRACERLLQACRRMPLQAVDASSSSSYGVPVAPAEGEHGAAKGQGDGQSVDVLWAVPACAQLACASGS